MCTIISGGTWTVLAFNLLGQAALTNKRIFESLHNDPPCGRWLHLFYKLINYTNQALLGVAVLQVDGVHGDFGQSQHASKSFGLRLNFQYFTDHIWNVFFTQRLGFERVSLCKRKAEKLNAVAFTGILSKRFFASFYMEYQTCHFLSPS